MNLLSPLEINKNYELQALSNEAVFGDAESSVSISDFFKKQYLEGT
jgi:hypothetical protein